MNVNAGNTKTRRDVAFEPYHYKKAALAAMATATATVGGVANALIIHSGAISTTNTGDIGPAGAPAMGLTIGVSSSSSSLRAEAGPYHLATGSTANRYVRLGYPYGVSGYPFFRSSTGPTVGPGWTFYTSAGPIQFQNLSNNAVLGTDNLYGFKMKASDINGGGVVYGWARLNIPVNPVDILSASQARIIEWAYDDSGASIGLGDSGAAAVPEPSTSLPLLALGAAGVLAHRRRRRELEAEKAS